MSSKREEGSCAESEPVPLQPANANGSGCGRLFHVRQILVLGVDAPGAQKLLVNSFGDLTISEDGLT